MFATAFATRNNCNAKQNVSVTFNEDDPKIAFAVGDIKTALLDTGYGVGGEEADRKVIFDFFQPGMGPQAFRIRKEGGNAIRVVGGDSLGAMYGGLELAEMIALGGGLEAVREKARKPYVFRRGLKFNIPLDARAPSYDDTGTAAQKNIPVMWEFSFWREFLDTMARNRYNVLSLWTTHPYPGLVKLDKYPGIGYDDVCVLKQAVDMSTNRHFNDLDVYDPDNFSVVKEISLDEKIAYWNKVFDYAEERGIEIYIFHWNIYTFGAKGKHGIDDRPDNLKTIEYMRYCIGEFLKTYPQVDGIGVTAGEHVDRQRVRNVGGIEEWLWRTYGQGVMDAKAENPGREVRFIFRQHQASLGKIVNAFKDFDGPFNTGHKYARARIYSTTTSPYLDIEYREDLERHKVPCWLNLRNDDIFVHRWGDADYVREFLQNIPRDLMRFEAGFYMGPDGYVWGREFVSKNPALSGESEANKHWYRFMLWGRLGYDLTLTRDYFEKRLAHRFPQVAPTPLYDTWAAASQIVPLVNHFFFRVNDLQFSPEGCMYNQGFLTVDAFFQHPPLRGSGILSVQEYASSIIEGQQVDGITPMEVAENLDRLAEVTLNGAKAMRNVSEPGQELAATLIDMESMAYLGRYYADKIRGAAELAVFQADSVRKQHKERAVHHLTNAVEEWEAYARVASSQYRPQLFSRTHYMDWWKRLEDVKKEVETVRAYMGSN
ncbi:hypothetical protein AMJ85_11205 [candidate division BRC1 bacterium SM23_51]|nr:MAG: hypothetical protein AMJ85_11205 [candidate division BRC1 bacterium SM23_51]